MRFRRSFKVHAPLPKVVEFHMRSTNMAAITPPPIMVRNQQAPDRLQEGDRMEFTMWFGPLPIRWAARIESVTPSGFVDRQLAGPFNRWLHRHSFQSLTAGTTEVTDEVEYEIRPHPVWGPIGLMMGLGLPILFAYRGWKTRRLLQGGENAPSERALDEGAG